MTPTLYILGFANVSTIETRPQGVVQLDQRSGKIQKQMRQTVTKTPREDLK
jgi:hypothetical protein